MNIKIDREILLTPLGNVSGIVEKRHALPILSNLLLEGDQGKLKGTACSLYTHKENYKIGGVDKKRSFIDSANSFPENIEILHTLTFSANKAPRKNQTKSFSFQINHSIKIQSVNGS